MEILLNWSVMEPILGWFGFIVELAVVMSALVYFLRRTLEKKSKFVKGKKNHIWVVIQVGHPVVENFVDQYKVQPDYVLDPELMLGHLAMSGKRDYSKFVKEFRNILKDNQNKEIRVVTSGMTGLNALLGQAAGLQYDLAWYQWDITTMDYKRIPEIEDIL